MQLTGLTSRQVVIAEALWNAQDENTIVALMLAFGKQEVQTMQSLMIAEMLDNVSDTDLATDVLAQFRSA
ncbi:MAG: hypothetical protein EB010_09935 [Acidimicrobiia bacterium]|jgi:hypothetical protein|nr:hypothetical protein [Actinomycetota bacterium]NDA79088.1 hypothetical protein [Actinomycetota bacterium]NDB06857.1 hypothetical protein [Acidimicrobiia bacterium]NDE59724.1 hypothetical protein [Acidimicrobiia bacterium]